MFRTKITTARGHQTSRQPSPPSEVELASNDAWSQRRRLSLPEPTISTTSRLLVERYLSRLPDAVIGKRYGDALFHPAPGWWRYSFSPYLIAIANLDLTPSSVLDVGCGDGLISNFYAFLYPEAEVIALDLCGLCLISTRTIAARLGLKNLHIVQGDAANLRSLFPRRTFDLVLARAFSAFGNRCSCDRSLGDPIDEIPETDKATRIIQAIQHILSPANGKFISTENWSGPAELWCWASTLASCWAGYRLDAQPGRQDWSTQMVHAGVGGSP